MRMTILIGFVVFICLICLIGFAFGGDAARGFVRLLLIVGGIAAAYAFAAAEVEMSKPPRANAVSERWGNFRDTMMQYDARRKADLPDAPWVKH